MYPQRQTFLVMDEHGAGHPQPPLLASLSRSD
jgi:hypothetical protein